MKALKIAAAFVAALAFAPAAFAEEGDVKKGEKVFKKCKACHEIGEGAKNKIGPALTGFIGRAVGTAEDFKYSKALTAKNEEGIVWTDEVFLEFITKPKKWAKGTKMAFGGIKKEDQRIDLVAYLKENGACAEEGCPAAE